MAYPRRGTENTLNPFYPRRAAEGHGEHLKPFLSAEDAEGHEEHLNTFLSAEDAEGHEEHLNTFLSAEDAEGRGGARRTPLPPQIMVVDHENQARNGPILRAGVLFWSHCEQASPNGNGTW